MEQVGLHDTAAVDRGRIAQPDQVRLRQPVGLAPDTAADARAEAAQPRAHHGGTADRAGQPRHREYLDEGVGQLVAPHEAAPQWTLTGPEPADQQPLRGAGDDAGEQPRGEQDQPAGRRRDREPGGTGERLERSQREYRECDAAHDRYQAAELDRELWSAVSEWLEACWPFKRVDYAARS